MIDQTNDDIINSWNDEAPYDMNSITTEPEDNYNTDEPDKDLTSNSNEDENIISSFLKTFGIIDSSKIPFENEEGVVEEIDFNSLTKQEQLELLIESSKGDMNENDLEILSVLKQKNLTIEDAIEYAKKEAVEEYLKTNSPTTQYTIDQFSDDELYLADLQQRFPNLTEEELVSRLEHSKAFPSYEKEVTQLRQYYKNIEEEQIKLEEEKEKQVRETYYNDLKQASDEFKSIRIDPTDKTSDVIVVDDNERNLVLKYITDTDANGVSQFINDIKDPNKLFKMAYLNLYADELLSNIASHHKSTQKPNTSKTVIVNQPKSEKTSFSTVQVEEPSWLKQK